MKRMPSAFYGPRQMGQIALFLSIACLLFCACNHASIVSAQHMREFVDCYKLDQLTVSDQKSNAGFCLHDDGGRFVYYVPRECEYFGLRLPKEHQGQTMTITWFDPLTGEYSKPKIETIPQWPAVKKPEGDQFRLLVVELIGNSALSHFSFGV